MSGEEEGSAGRDSRGSGGTGNRGKHSVCGYESVSVCARVVSNVLPDNFGGKKSYYQKLLITLCKDILSVASAGV